MPILSRWQLLASALLTSIQPSFSASAVVPSEEPDKNGEDECRVYLAPTTIPNAGMGIFAGRNFEPGDTILYEDVAVPVDDMPFHTGSRYKGEIDAHFIWKDYTWDTTIAEGIDFDYEGVTNIPEGVLETVELASFGLGAMPNCKFALVNLHSTVLLGDTAALDRSSPGNGAFTPYHARKGLAAEPIVAGAELFENYGFDYFDQRDTLSHVPQEGDFQLADTISKKLQKIRDQLSGKDRSHQSLMLDLYDVVKNAWSNSRVTNALPTVQEIMSDPGNLDLLLEQGPANFDKRHAIRDVEWLKKNGQCMDGIRSGISKIPDAGRGAFATRRFQKGSRIAPVPLIHIVDKSVFDMYTPVQSTHEEYEYDAEYDEEFYYPRQRNMTIGPVHKALLLNYCFGHPNSTMLLSLYGSITSLINHGSGEAANARMVWAHEWMSHPQWLNMTPQELSKIHFAGLGWDLIALRDIQPDEEILIDYGSDWEHAWQEHKHKWKDNIELYTGTSVLYVRASELNEDIEKILTRAVENNIDYSYMGHGVSLYCYNNRDVAEDDEDAIHDPTTIQTFVAQQECRPVAKHTSILTGKTVFTVEIVQFFEVDEPNGHGTLWEREVSEVRFGVPASNFHFEDLPFNAAHRMPWSFRHEIRIPDDLFPEAWANLNNSD